MATRRNRPRKSKKYRGGGLVKPPKSMTPYSSRVKSFNRYRGSNAGPSKRGIQENLIIDKKADRPPVSNSQPASKNWQHSRSNPTTLEQQLRFQKSAMNYQRMWNKVKEKERTELSPGLLQPNGSLATTMQVPEGMRYGVRPTGLRSSLNMP
jgi:hypothetical protein